MNVRVLRAMVIAAMFVSACGPGAIAPSSSSGPASSTQPASTPPEGETKSGGTLRVGVGADAKTLDPHISAAGLWRAQLSSLYDRALDIDPTTLQLVPALVTEWTWADLQTLKLTTRSDVKFHDGQDFTADDLKWNIDRYRDPDTGSPWSGPWQTVTDVVVDDPTHLTLRLASPSVGLAFQLAYVWVMPKDGDPTAGIGTGPFQLDKYTPNVSLKLKRNPSYWREGQPTLDGLEYHVLPEVEARYAALETGDIDVAYDTPAADVPRFASSDAIKVATSAASDQQFLVLVNSRRPGLDNEKVRQAIAYATDRDTFIREFTAGLGRAGNSPIPPGHWAFSEEVDKVYSFDLDKARQLLVEAGHPNGEGLPELTFVISNSIPEFTSGSEMMQAALAEIGIKSRIERLEGSAWLDRVYFGTFDWDFAWDYPGRGGADPDFMFRGPVYKPGETNVWGVTDDVLPEYSREIQAGGATTDEAARKDHYTKALTTLLEYVGPIVVGQRPLVVLHRADVNGLSVHALQLMSYGPVWLDR